MSARKYNNKYAHLEHPRGGKYGTIPRRLLEDKYEITLIDEDPDRSNQFMRSTLKDFRADPVLFESDNPRTNAMTSIGALNLRLHGSRGNTSGPNHSEMFLGFTDHDPRGTATDPDFKKYTEDSWKRRKRTEMNLFPDKGEDRITQGGTSESHIAEIKKQMFYPVKDRLKIFSTEKDGELLAGRPYETTKPMLHGVRATDIDPINKLQNHQDFLTGSDGLYRMPDHTVLGSLYVAPFQKQQPDHQIKVAKYGMIKRGLHIYDIGGPNYNSKVSDDKYWKESSENNGKLMAGNGTREIPTIYKAIEYAMNDQKIKDGKDNKGGVKISHFDIQESVNTALAKLQNQSRMNGKHDSDEYSHHSKFNDVHELEHAALYTRMDSKQRESRDGVDPRTLTADKFTNNELLSMQMIQNQMTGVTSEKMGVIVRAAAMKQMSNLQDTAVLQQSMKSSNGRVLQSVKYKNIKPKDTIKTQDLTNADQILKQSKATFNPSTARLDLLPTNMGGIHNTHDDASKQALANNDGMARNRSLKTVKSNQLHGAMTDDSHDNYAGSEKGNMMMHRGGSAIRSALSKRSSMNNMDAF